MIRNLKALGLALCAMLALGAMTASAASATDFFTGTKAKGWVTGTSHNNKFHIVSEAATFECTTSKFTGTVENGSTEATALATYEGLINDTPHDPVDCNSTAGQVVVVMNHCHYRLTGNTTNEHPVGGGKNDAVIWIQCPVGSEIEIQSTAGCTIKVPSQTPTQGGVTYTNVNPHAGGNAVKVTATVTGIKWTAHGFVCAFGGLATEGHDATYQGDVTVTGFEDNGGTFTAPTEGARIGVEVS